MSRRLVPLLACTALVAGCGDGREPSAVASPSPSPPASAPSTGAPPADAVTTYTEFRSPSGNIRCGLDPVAGYVRCDIGERDWEPPPRPADCTLDYGSGLEVDGQGARVVCAGDAIGASQRFLPYGERLQGGPIVCTSAESGMTCEHTGSGRSFAIARASYRLS